MTNRREPEKIAQVFCGQSRRAGFAVEAFREQRAKAGQLVQRDTHDKCELNQVKPKSTKTDMHTCTRGLGKRKKSIKSESEQSEMRDQILKEILSIVTTLS